jgi:L-threonine kinase
VVGVDEGGQVDTLDFNAVHPPFSRSARAEYAVLLDRLATALATGDLATLGAVATRSAELNQDRCHKRHLSAMTRICHDTGGLGVVVAHSGTVVGIAFAAADPDHDGKVADARTGCAGLGLPVSVDRTTASATSPTATPGGGSHVD